MRVQCKNELNDVSKILDEIKKVSKDIGCVVIYVGVVRSDGGRALGLEYKMDPKAAEEILAKICEEAKSKYGLLDAIIEHKTGLIPVGENVMIVAVASRHRGEAFQAIKEIVDKIKNALSTWKREITKIGTK